MCGWGGCMVRRDAHVCTQMLTLYNTHRKTPTATHPPTPTWAKHTRLIVYDHHTSMATILALHDTQDPQQYHGACAWIHSVHAQLHALHQPSSTTSSESARRVPVGGRMVDTPLGWVLREPRGQYHANVNACIEVGARGWYDWCVHVHVW